MKSLDEINEEIRKILFDEPTNRKSLNQSEIINEHNYFIYDSTSSNPKIILIGDLHGKCDKSIEEILLSITDEGDAIFFEGQDNRKIDRFNQISAFYNDSSNLTKLAKYFSNRRKENIYNIMSSKNKLESMYHNFMRYINSGAIQVLNYFRDLNFTQGKYGLVKQTKNFSKLYQVIGMVHILSGNITQRLKKENIPYAILMPSIQKSH
tara:strand:- start:136 stop:759 length:624 start_codon:yes stop_codon:yes gene_type:complete